MYQRILVPLDGSELAEVALPYAEELAGKLGSEIILIHAAESPGKGQDEALQSYLKRMVNATAQNAMKHVSKLGAHEVKVRSQILVGDAAEALIDFAEKEAVELIVMATHGRTGIRRWALGSVATKMVTASNRPMVLIRAKGTRPDVREQGAVRKTLVPLDGSQTGEAIIPYVRELASKLKGEVVLFQTIQPLYNVVVTVEGAIYVPYTPEEMKSMVTTAEGYLQKVSGSLSRQGVEATSKVTIGSAADEIIRFADETHADLVAMSTHGRSGIDRWAFGSVADKVLHAGNTPILLVRAEEKAPA